MTEAAQTGSIQDRLAFARKLADEAGAMALDFFNRRETLVIETKKNLQDVVSIADRSVEEMLRAKVAETFPEDGFLGEEYGQTEGASPYTWIVDPIDGTAPFVNGMPTWCVSIAVARDGEPVVGVIIVPCLDEIYAAAEGLGATLNGKVLTLDPSRTMQNGLTGIGSNSHVTPEKVGAIVTALMANGGNLIRNGSGALMLAYVAAGKLVGYYEPYMHAWDCMAGYCLVKEAGGHCLPFPGDRVGITKGAPVIAAAPGARDDIWKLADV
ncbi:inositol monophosphatase family protein [Roseibium litorale]|uniref:Inositol monophosphatase family protein n=1 Tax=Roseibium litorale TaxID=2803841 RepID=A0ABR9CJD3_9HYPH|nr:inositol monophosphatase family protein [Roseibium litorale]MBD8890948.1 inositol monophosphatase family protein [Roseibium litorale]